MFEAIWAIDDKFFYLVHHGCSNLFLNYVMPWVSDIAKSNFIFFIGLIFIFLKGKKNKMVGLLFLAGQSLAYFAVHYIKAFVAKPRPFILLSDVHLLQAASGYSFPSGHATRIFMAAFILMYYFKVRIFFYAFAILVAFSRLYLGAHFPTDVFAGALLGTLIGYILVEVSKNYDVQSS